MKKERKPVVRQAFYRSLPVMAGYMILGAGFGILLRDAGYGALWAFLMSAFIYAGAMQFVGIGLITGGASVLTTLLTTFMVNARHLFYSISMIDKYRDAGAYKPYLIFALTDETYSLLCDDASAVTSALTKNNFYMTRLATTGGFLRAGNTTLIVGTEDELVDKCIETIGSEAKRRTEIVPSTASYDIGRYASFPVEVQIGGATIFVLDVEQFIKL